MRYYEAFNYDFNNPRGRVVIKNSHFQDDYALEIGQDILLVSIGESIEDYEGFGALVTITGVLPAPDPDYSIVLTDLADRQRKKD